MVNINPNGSLAAKLDRLFHTIHPPGRESYSYDEASDAINAKGGPTISSTYLWMLRTGQRDNPTKNHLEALADFFGVPPSYFFDDSGAEQIQGQLELLAALRDDQVCQIACRAYGLSPAALSSIAGIIERAREIERLPHNHGPLPTRRRRRGGDQNGER